MVTTYENDYYNINGRNSRNTSQYDYNCGGYALGTFNWYCPYETDKDHTSNLRTKMSVDSMADHYAEFMLQDFFGRLRIIKEVKEIRKDEKAIAFRCCGEDFHFCVRGDNGVWYHKPGGNTIRRIKKEEVFADEWYSPRGLVVYTSKIILFAMKKS